MGSPIRVRNPHGLISWVSAEHAEALLRQPGWERVEDAPKPKTQRGRKPARGGN